MRNTNQVFHYHAPLDPRCREVREFYKSADDPFMAESGCWGEFLHDFEAKHRRECKRCQKYGAENIEVVGP